MNPTGMDASGYAQLTGKEEVLMVGAYYTWVDGPWDTIGGNLLVMQGPSNGRFTKHFGSNADGHGSETSSACGGGLLKVFYQAKMTSGENVLPVGTIPAEPKDPSWTFVNSLGFRPCCPEGME